MMHLKRRHLLGIVFSLLFVFVLDSIGKNTAALRSSSAVQPIEQSSLAASRPVEGVSITGPASGDVGVEYRFTAAVTPQDASPPVRYVWSPAPAKGQRRETATYIWNVPGKYDITVTAYNATGTATASYRITIGPTIPIDSVQISGPGAGILNESDTFIASVWPTNADLPITYNWSPPPASGQNTNQATYQWTSLGSQTIQVTATNDVSSKIDTHSITIESRPLTGVAIVGPITGTYHYLSGFTAVITPANATTPITHTWSPEPISGQLTGNALYFWQVTGTVTITVRSENIGSSKSANHRIFVSPEPQPVTAVDIDGPTIGVIGASYAFEAVHTPPDAAQPVFDWSPNPDNGDSSSTAEYRWDTPGRHTISVTATNYTLPNNRNSVFGTHTIDIKAAIIQLPVTVRRWPPVPDAPQPNPIPDPGNAPDYTITWSSAYLAEIYVVEEDTNSDFSDPVEACRTGQTFCVVSGSSPARYFYRIRACNSWGCSGWSNPISVHVRWEREPNTYIYQANGPLLSGYDYYGYPDQTSATNPYPWDCFYIQSGSSGLITVDLFNHAGQDTQLLLYYQSYANLKKRDYTSPYRVEYTGAPGQYFICAYSVGGNPAISYTLRITYPD